MGIAFIVAGICQGITLIVLQSNVCLDNPVLQYVELTDPDISETFGDQCEKAAGYTINIVATTLFLLAGAS